jgi:predicted acylesterase/phospholipase RssA
MPVTRTYRFHEIFKEEVQAINQRRRQLHRGEVELELESRADTNPNSESDPAPASSRSLSPQDQADIRSDGEPILRPTLRSGLAGLALSGGGIRSASFCLGALQALDKACVLKKIDYLSTVSGGGYIGTSLSAAMSRSKGAFPFTSSLTQDEPYPVQHVRNHSNYLFPQGIINIFYNVAIYLRGLLANALLILPWLLVLAAITIFFKPDSESLHISLSGTTLPEAFNADHFGLSLIVLYLFVLLLLVWALWRSLEISGWAAEIGSPWTLVSALVLIVLIVIAFCELQPLVLDGIFRSANRQGGILASFATWLQGLAALLAPFSAAVAFFSRHIGRLLRQGNERPNVGALASRAAGRAAVYIAGAAIPFLLWMAYLYLCFAGIKDLDPDYVNWSGSYYHAPLWLSDILQHWFGYKTPIGWFYLVTGIELFLLSLFLAPNANSPHRLYRDRLSKAFLFDPTIIEARRSGPGSKLQSAPLSDPAAFERLKYGNFELAPLDRFKLSEISCVDTPFHLINTALNIQGSKYANRRGRNADFFVFSPKFIGSGATQYVRTEEFEDAVKELDLATAMAVSGAAASSNMGANSIKALTPTLAILNVRLGYWVANPRQLAKDRKPSSVFASVFDQFYFLQELLGLMRETSNTIYLTDGGHIENLGIYELLRRRCQLIIAVDADGDPEMSFRSLVALQRYARIDLGVLIDLPWAEIRDATRAASEEIARTGGLPPNAAAHGPHCAVGEIGYPLGRKGILIYVKSSITGDENDYIVDYKRRFPTYPHETTADQLFSEEQFEVYRALGFHAVTEVFSGRDQVGMRPKAAQWQGTILNEPLVKEAKELLNWT